MSEQRRQAHDGMAAETDDLTTDELFGAVTRRSMLGRGATGGLALGTAGLLSGLVAEAASARGLKKGPLPEPNELTRPVEIFRIATIAEQLAVTFYSNGVANASKLGLDDFDLKIIKAAGIEEQIHQKFFRSVIALLTGRKAPRTVGPTTFGFPFPNTFTDLRTFIATQQVLEGVFDSAFLAAIRELSRQGQHRAAQIAGQVAAIESEHRALGRGIAARHGIETLPNPLPGMFRLTEPDFFRFPDNFEPGTVPTTPPDNWAFAPVFLESVGDAPGIVKKAGFLSPREGNSFNYDPINFNSTYREVFDKIFFREPLINLG